MIEYLSYIAIGITAISAIWLSIAMWDMNGITGYRRDVLRWLDDMGLYHRFDEAVMREYFERGESSWNAAQAMMDNDGGKRVSEANPLDRFVRCEPYEAVKFIWVSNHYDLHLSGICNDNGELRRFETNYDTGEVSLFALTMREKVKWKMRQLAFELCVGKHCTYPDRKNGARFYYRRPKWFWKLIFRAYYAST